LALFKTNLTNSVDFLVFASMRPILLKGHERSITSLRFNRDGDLLFTTSKHPNFAVWYSDNGERLGTYHGHNGAVWSIDIDRHSEQLITGSADTNAKLWSVETGREITSWGHKAPVRSAQFSYGDKRFLTVTDGVFGLLPAIYVWDLNADARLTTKPIMELQGRGEAKIQYAAWGPLNETILTSCEDGTIRVYDVRNGEQIKTISDHTKAVMQLNFSPNRKMFVSASKDGTAKLFDAKTYKHLKTYDTGRPVNSAAISPNSDYELIMLGGGQSAESVTTTRVDNTQFRVRMFHSIFEEELASVQGHFGPVNVLSWTPDGRGFASGGEDGYVRLHHFDESFFTEFHKDNLRKRGAPADAKEEEEEELLE